MVPTGDFLRWFADTSPPVANIINNAGLEMKAPQSIPGLFVKPRLCCLSLWCSSVPKLISESKFYLKESIQLCYHELRERKVVTWHFLIFWSVAYLQICPFLQKDQSGAAIALLQSSQQLQQLVQRPSPFPCWKAASWSALSRECTCHSESRS